MFDRRTAARRSLLPAATVLAALVAVGCVAAPGASLGGGTRAAATPAPTASATAPPTAAPTPSRTASPSASPSASRSPVTPSGGTAGCGVATYAKGANDLVFRLTLSGGFVPPGTDLTNVPVISVYGDGRIVSPGPQILIYPGPLVPALQVQTLSEDGMRKLLDAAGAAGLLVKDVTYESHGIADAPTSFFTLTADGCTHHVNAYALSESDSTTDLDKATIEARAKLLAFRNAISYLPTLVGADNVADGGLYEPSSYRVVTREEPAGSGSSASAAPAVKWPLATPIATFGEVLAPGMVDMRCGVVDGADAATLKPLFDKANAETLWTSAGKTYYLRVRPLLPDETGCKDDIA